MKKLSKIRLQKKIAIKGPKAFKVKKIKGL